MNNKGFTLIELLVVVLIIGVLSAIALPQYTKAVEKARSTEAMAWLSDFITAQSIYHMANGTFASDLADLDLGLDAGIMKNFSGGDPAEASATGVTSTLTRTAGSMNYSLKVTMLQNPTTGNIEAKRECTGNNAACHSITNGNPCSTSSDHTESAWCYTPVSSSAP